ncbi:phage virion morphogenesis protein [Pasteurella multocida]|uniref:phage virion morphogenesis protein n=1 Tax=Pasteurella multocida TaxID=747 RepID=UPI003979D56B
MIHIQLNADEALQGLHRTAESLKQGRKLYGILGEALRTIHKERFEKEQASPAGEKWQPLSSMYKARKRKNRDKILIRDGNLKNLLRYQVNDNGVEFGSDRKYARLHHLGSSKTKGRGSGVVARPWLGVNQNNKDYLLKKTQHFLRNVITRI